MTKGKHCAVMVVNLQNLVYPPFLGETFPAVLLIALFGVCEVFWTMMVNHKFRTVRDAEIGVLSDI